MSEESLLVERMWSLSELSLVLSRVLMLCSVCSAVPVRVSPFCVDLSLRCVLVVVSVVLLRSVPCLLTVVRVPLVLFPVLVRLFLSLLSWCASSLSVVWAALSALLTRLTWSVNTRLLILVPETLLASPVRLSVVWLSVRR